MTAHTLIGKKPIRLAWLWIVFPALLGASALWYVTPAAVTAWRSADVSGLAVDDAAAQLAAAGLEVSDADADANETFVLTLNRKMANWRSARVTTKDQKIGLES